MPKTKQDLRTTIVIAIFNGLCWPPALIGIGVFAKLSIRLVQLGWSIIR